jgi:hypothetical protein
MGTELGKELAALKRLTVGKLREKYAEVFGEPTNGHNRPWLVRRIAWRLQERALGGLATGPRRGRPSQVPRYPIDRGLLHSFTPTHDQAKDRSERHGWPPFLTHLNIRIFRVRIT